MKNFMLTILVLSICSLFTSLTQAVETNVYLVKNARVVTMTDRGILQDTDILIKGKHIVTVGKNLVAKKGTEIIDAKGKFVTPGLFDSATQLGLAEVESSTNSTDNRVEDQPLAAGFSLSLALNRHSSFIPMVRKTGITRAMVVPATGSEILAGQSAIIQLGEQLPFATNAANAVHLYLREVDRDLAGGSRASALAKVLSSLEEAQRYADNKPAYQRGKTREFHQSESDLKSLLAVLKRQKPLVVHIDRAADIEIAIEQLHRFNIRLVLAGAREGWKVKNLLAEKHIPVILNVLDNLPSKFDRLGARLDNAAILNAAGVTVALMTQDLYTETRSLTQGAGIAVAYGMPWQAAMKAITANPAGIWGLTDFGKIKSGMIADIVIWDGDPLEVMSAPEQMMIAGHWMNLTTRQDLLKERYRDLSAKQPPFGYR